MRKSLFLMFVAPMLSYAAYPVYEGDFSEEEGWNGYETEVVETDRYKKEPLSKVEESLSFEEAVHIAEEIAEKRAADIVFEEEVSSNELKEDFAIEERAVAQEESDENFQEFALEPPRRQRPLERRVAQERRAVPQKTRPAEREMVERREPSQSRSQLSQRGELHRRAFSHRQSPQHSQRPASERRVARREAASSREPSPTRRMTERRQATPEASRRIPGQRAQRQERSENLSQGKIVDRTEPRSSRQDSTRERREHYAETPVKRRSSAQGNPHRPHVTQRKLPQQTSPNKQRAIQRSRATAAEERIQAQKRHSTKRNNQQPGRKSHHPGKRPLED